MTTAASQVLDGFPTGAVFVGFVVIALVIFDVGYLAGRWWQARTPDEKEGVTGMLVGANLAILGFLLAVTTGMASGHFDARRAIVLDEANAIRTTYMRAGALPEPTRDEIRMLIREYVPLRIVPADDARLQANIDRSREIHDEIWMHAEGLARQHPESTPVGLFIESFTAMVDVHTGRIVTGLYSRVPETLVGLLFVGSLLAVGMAGYNAGLTRRRSLASAVTLVLVLGAATTLVVDLDRPRDGYLRINQQALEDLAADIGTR